MTETELIEKAKRDYPIGTKFRSIYGVQDTVKECNPKICNGNQICINGAIQDGRIIYSMGKWAEIIESPKKEETSLVGRYLKILKVDDKDCEEGTKMSILTSTYYPGAFIKLKTKYSNSYGDGNTAMIKYPFSSNFELMPIGWTPEQENKQEEQWIPKVGDWFYVIKNEKGRLLKTGDVKQIIPNEINKNEVVYLDCVYFEKGSNIRIDRIRKALPHEIPQESNVIPEYVECIDWSGTMFENGKIYEVNKMPNNVHPFEGHKHCFRPSTKEAYLRILEKELIALL